MTIKDIRKKTGLSQLEFAAKYHIPLDTIRGWESNETSSRHRECPTYVRFLLEKVVSTDFNLEFNEKSLISMVKFAGFEDLISVNFEEAKNNDRKRNIVIINDSDIYLTYKLNGIFGEFVCWVEDEFIEDETVYDAVLQWIGDIYSRTDARIEKDINNGRFPFDFKPYDDNFDFAY